MNHRRQSPSPHPQQPQGDPHSSRLLTEAEATAFVKVFDSAKSPVRQFREWACRWGVPVKRVGRRRLYDQKVLEAFMERAPWTRRHALRKAS